MKIICIPYAGGQGKVFDKLIEHLSDELESYYIVEYSGHGKRKNERLIDNWDESLKDISCQINANISVEDEYLVIGYSMGSIMAYEMIRKNMLACRVSALIVISHEPPHQDWESKKYYKMDMDNFVNRMIEFGGIDKKLIENKRFLSIFMRPLVNDYKLIGTYECQEIYKLGCPLFVSFSKNDLKEENMREWSMYTNRKFMCDVLEGNHFLLDDNLDYYVDIIKNKYILEE